MFTRAFPILCLAMAWSSEGHAQAEAAAKLYAVEEKDSTITYRLAHKMHPVVGVAKKGIEGKAKLAAGGAQLMVRVPVASFDSGNSNRDVNMQQVVEAAKYPHVELKAVTTAVTPGTNAKHVLKGKLTFHGVTRDVEIPIETSWSGAERAKVTGKFTISLEAYKVERPSLLFVKVEDALDLEIDLTIAEAR